MTTALVLPTFSTSVPTNRQKDTTHTKLFVGGLPYHTTDKTLKEHFQAYGEIDEAVVITDRSTGKSKGYGFVIMSTKEEAEAALQEPNPIIEGRKANVNLAILGAKPRGNAAPKLPITAISPEFATLLGGQYGGLGIAAPQALAPAPYAVPTTLQAAATAYQLATPAAPGKARSSMNLSSISGRPYHLQAYQLLLLSMQLLQDQPLQQAWHNSSNSSSSSKTPGISDTVHDAAEYHEVWLHDGCMIWLASYLVSFVSS